MKLRNQISRAQKKKDIIVISVFLVLSVIGMSVFFLTEFFMWTFDIYFTPHFFVACFNLLICIVLIFGLAITLNPLIRINKNTLLIIDALHMVKKISLNSVKTITAEANRVILDDKYKNNSMIIDVFYINRTIRFALSENDYNRFINCNLIAEKINK